jgi:3-isopropylmalate/(R)-2-methylmalate dehydratase large subunit
MPMTITEKILAAHASRKQLVSGELISTRVDLALGNDITAPMAIKEFEKIGVAEI